MTSKRWTSNGSESFVTYWWNLNTGITNLDNDILRILVQTQFLSCLNRKTSDEAFQHHNNCSWSILIFWISIVMIQKLFEKVQIQYKNTVAPSKFMILSYISFGWECVRLCLRCLDQNKKVVLTITDRSEANRFLCSFAYYSSS